MSCCYHCRATEAKFGHKTAERDLHRYRRRGPDQTTSEIISAIRGLELEGATLLDVGGGIGVIQHEMIGAGVRSAALVEAASAYLQVAKQETESRGNGTNAAFFHGNFADIAARVPAADVVTLDRVICCYPDYEELLNACAGKCRGALALSYPRDRWYVRLVMALHNLGRRLARDPFRTFVHPPDAMDRVLAAAGLTVVKTSRSLAWRVTLYTYG